MNKIIEKIELIDRMDQLIRLKATGTPKSIARRLNLSESSIYRLIDIIKDMGAPVEFSVKDQSYIYSSDVRFICGFFIKELALSKMKKISGGCQKRLFTDSIRIFLTFIN